MYIGSEYLGLRFLAKSARLLLRTLMRSYEQGYKLNSAHYHRTLTRGSRSAAVIEDTDIKLAHRVRLLLMA